MDTFGSHASGVLQLELQGLCKQLGGKPVVTGIDLAIAPGESVVLLGPSGCGKSTTLRMVAGFTDPDAGTIKIEGNLVSGKGVSLPTERRHLGMVFQSYAVWPHKTVFENVAFGLRVAGIQRKSILEKVHKVLDIVRLSHLAGRLPSELSGGQQQRVALARAIVTEPRLLLLDEPLSNLDASLREELRSELRRLHSEAGITTLYVTHDQEEALVLADRIAVMDNGKIVQFDTPEGVYKRPATAFVASFVGSPNLIVGKVSGKNVGAGEIQVEVSYGGIISAQLSAELLSHTSVGDPITVVIRPEDLRIADNGKGIHGQIVDIVFLGSSYETAIAVNGNRMRIRTRSKPNHVDGNVVLTAAPRSAWAVPCE